MKFKTLLIGLFIFFQFLYSPVYGEYYTVPPSSPVLMHLAGSLTINGSPAEPGDEIAVFDPLGNIIGQFIINTEGLFGDLPVSGDVGITGDVEGAANGDNLIFKVWRKFDDREYYGSSIRLSKPEREKGIYSPFHADEFGFVEGFYLLDVDVR